MKLLKAIENALLFLILAALWIGFMELSLLMFKNKYPVLHSVLAYVMILYAAVLVIRLVTKKIRRRNKVKRLTVELDQAFTSGTNDDIAEVLAKFKYKEIRNILETGAFDKHKERFEQFKKEFNI